MTGCLGSSMIVQGESPLREALDRSRSLMDPKKTIKIGAWNVRTMYQVSKTAQVIKEMKRYQLGIIGISECRWTGSGRIKTQGYTIIYSGRDDDQHTEGVAIIMNEDCAKSLIEWEPINGRLIRARFNSIYAKTTIIQCYSPTNDAEEEDKDTYYEALQAQISRTPQHDVLLIIGDQNAKVGNDNSEHERAMGKEGYGAMNENGERLANLCSTNGLVIGGTIFKHKDIHKITWNSPNGRDKNQIDHIIVNGKWRRSLLDTRAYRGADVNSDHHLVVAKLQLKLKKADNNNQPGRKIIDIKRLKEPEIKQKFTIELKNRFRVLENHNPDEENSIEKKWENIKNVYDKTSEKIIGFRKKNDKTWLTASTWKMIEERGKLKEKVLSSKSSRLREQAQKDYGEKDKEVKRCARKDKRNYLEERAEEAEKAVARGDLNTVYKITKELCGQSKQPPPVKDKKGKIITTEKEQAARWVEHFKDILNRPEPTVIFEGAPQKDDLKICTDPPSKEEITKAIKSMKPGKAAGIDGIQAELLKADMGTATEELHSLFIDIWEENKIPADWSKGLIVKLSKKGDLGNCDNWRGITLLSIPSKVFCRILLNRIDEELDKTLRQEQAGFRKGRGCIDQIFALKNIVEQCIEWKTPLYINFIDFKKAFDSIHRETLWTILRSYGIPDKIVTLIKCFYTDFECAVLLNNKTTEWFAVKSGVRQGCIISPILFLVVIDWVMRKTTSDQRRGITWSMFSTLEDLDFADDIALLSSKQDHMQEKTNRLSHYASQTGLQINAKKTQEMRLNTTSNTRLVTEGMEIEQVDNFTYLGSIVSTQDPTQKDIKSRLAKARSAFQRLRPVWKSKQYSRKTKIRIYNSNVKSILLYGSECWRVTKSDMRSLSSFHHGCLRQICRIYWPRRISNKDLLDMTESTCIIEQIQQRRFRWLGHVFRMPGSNITKVALRWTPQGKRPRGRPKTTWRRTIEAELRELGMTWGEAEAKAKNRAEWRDLVVTLCSDRSEEDR